MSEVKLYAVELSDDELSVLKRGLHKMEAKNKKAILDYRKNPHYAEDKDLKRWYKEDIEEALVIMELREKLYNVE
jgi:hypothetical protein